MKKIELVFFDAGGGHRSAANALCEQVRREGRNWNMAPMNLQELLDEMDIFRRITGVRLQDLYNLALRRGWTLGSAQMLPAMQAVIRLYHKKQVAILRRYWRGNQPDMVVSVVPNFNRAMHEAIRGVMPEVPFVTILTDIADYPPSFWIEKQEQYLICGSARAYQQALEMGHAPERVFRTSGMILHPKYYEPVDVHDQGRESLLLDPELPTALMMFGGAGSPKMIEIFRRLDTGDLRMQMIAICGRGKQIENSLRHMARRMPMHVVGFTEDVPRFMALSDFLIGKPGPGSISEAVAMKLPVIVETNAWTLPQERYNSQWVEENGVGIALRSFRTGIVDAVRRMIDPQQKAVFKTRVEAMRNRAIFEIPEILEKILQQHRL